MASLSMDISKLSLSCPEIPSAEGSRNVDRSARACNANAVAGASGLSWDRRSFDSGPVLTHGNKTRLVLSISLGRGFS